MIDGIHQLTDLLAKHLAVLQTHLVGCSGKPDVRN
jgi:hypothetical protein